jgi:preprotein translocase subunit YajC
MSFLITDALADTLTAAAPQQGNSVVSLLFMLGFVAVMYFLLWRPQAKRAKEQRNLIASLAKGDEVTTSGGLVGKISRLSDDFIGLTVAEGVEITMQKAAVVSILPKGTLKAV